MILQNPILKFTILLLNELNSPELLMYNYEIIGFFKELINYQNFLISIENFFSNEENISSILKKMEIDRIEYLVKTYHRIRIWKIEAELNNSEKKNLKYNRLTIMEKKYMHEYILLCNKFTNLTFLNFIPVKIKKIVQYSLARFNNESSYNDDVYVFFKILNKQLFIEENILKTKKLNEYYENQVYCIRYKVIKKLIYSGIIFLM
jgi:hypothetical protein